MSNAKENIDALDRAKNCITDLEGRGLVPGGWATDAMAYLQVRRDALRAELLAAVMESVPGEVLARIVADPAYLARLVELEAQSGDTPA